jgi:hypothetical protein
MPTSFHALGSSLLLITLLLSTPGIATAEGREIWAVPPEYEITREKIPVDEEFLLSYGILHKREDLAEVTHWQFYLKIENSEAPIPLAKRYKMPWSFDSCYGFSERSFKLEALTPELLHASWCTCAQGNGGYTMDTHMLLRKVEDAWKVLFRHTQGGHSDGGLSSQSDGGFRITPELESGRLILESSHSLRVEEAYEDAWFAFPTVYKTWQDGRRELLGYRDYTFLHEWEYEINGDGITCGEGSYMIDFKAHVHPIQEVARMLVPYAIRSENADVTPEERDNAFDKAIKRLRELNPKLLGREVCSGVVLLETGRPPFTPNTEHYYRMSTK